MLSGHLSLKTLFKFVIEVCEDVVLLIFFSSNF